jgi:hypothetical protein
MEDGLNREFDALLKAYRQAHPDPAPGADFMPRLWARIEARRNYTLRFKRLTQAFLAASATICLLIGGVLAIPGRHNSAAATYLDALAAYHPAENLSALGLPHADEPSH